MPIKVQNALPAKEILENENIFVMDENRAMHQDIRPLKGLHSEPHASEAGYRIAAVTGTVQYTAACGSDVYEDEQSYFPEYADPAFESLL